MLRIKTAERLRSKRRKEAKSEKKNRFRSFDFQVFFSGFALQEYFKKYSSVVKELLKSDYLFQNENADLEA